MEVNKIIQGDCLEVLKTLEENSIDAVVTDPPYGLSFMGKKWDYDVPSKEIWQECLRVLKPGGYLLSFAGTRTQHRMAVRIEDAGFEIRDMIAWVYGSGFPKSLNIGKAIDKLQGNEREEISRGGRCGVFAHSGSGVEQNIDDYETVVTKGTSEWEGWGTALKPALEPITVARKPLSEKTVAENVLKWGTAGINIDESRVEITDTKNGFRPNSANKQYTPTDSFAGGKITEQHPQGRFPANLILDNSEEVRECFPDSKAGKNKEEKGTGGIWSESSGLPCGPEYGDSGNASRFFKSIIYQAKSSKSERNKGCEDLEEKKSELNSGGIGRKISVEKRLADGSGVNAPKSFNSHPTVKPIALMEYLIKMVTPKGGIVLDPFAGSGSTLIACKKLGRNYIGCELDPEYIKIAEARIKAVQIDKQQVLI